MNWQGNLQHKFAGFYVPVKWQLLIYGLWLHKTNVPGLASLSSAPPRWELSHFLLPDIFHGMALAFPSLSSKGLEERDRRSLHSTRPDFSHHGFREAWNPTEQLKSQARVSVKFFLVCQTLIKSSFLATFTIDILLSGDVMKENATSN